MAAKESVLIDANSDFAHTAVVFDVLLLLLEVPLILPAATDT